jgi:hypothetical protein
MTQPIILTSADIRTWGERRAPLPRTKAYAFSLDMVFDGCPEKATSDAGADSVDVDGNGQRAAMQGGAIAIAGIQNKPSSHAFTNHSRLYHVRDEVLIKGADGKVRDVPQDARIVHATVRFYGTPTGGASLHARILANWQNSAFMSMDVTGVLNPGGPLVRLWGDDALDDTIETQISLRTECESSTFRWLVQNQLFGWGQLRIEREKRKTNEPKQPLKAAFTYDLYTMGG